MLSPEPPVPHASEWVFDVDGCLVDSLTGTSLRPGTRALLGQLRSRGVTVLVWSAGGAEYAQRRVTQFALGGLVAGCHAKGERDPDGAYGAAHLPVRTDAVFVDDHPEELGAHLHVVGVRSYLSPDSSDVDLDALARRLR
ncbi:MAG TPA: HAD family hydrolase [Acidimicrobiales bacterium]|nr:HAD family hydrolase [Acidimicrobiales bacterium]